MTNTRTHEDALRAADALLDAQIPGFEPNIPFVVATKALVADLAAALRETLAEASALRSENERLRDVLREIGEWQPGYYDNRDNSEAQWLSDRAREALRCK